MTYKDEGLIISVKEARKLMGKEAEKYTDEQVIKIITDLDFMAGMAISEFKKRNSGNAVDKKDL